MPDGGALTLYCSLMVGDVYLDGQLIGKPQGSMGRTYYDIEPGIHTVKITSPSWADWTKQVKIETGKKTKLYAYLAYGEDKGGTPRDEIIGPESDSLYGNLRIFCNVTQGNIYVGGEPGGVPQGEVGTTIRGLLPGTYTVTIVADGYAEWSGEVTVTTGETAEITAELTPA